MAHRTIAGVALALLLSIAAPAYAGEGDRAPPAPPAWQLPMLAGGGGLALGMLIRSRGLGVGSRSLQTVTRDPRLVTLGGGIDGPTERLARRDSARAEVRYQLIVWADGRRVVHELRGRQCVIGRDPGCDVQVDGPLVSALHARIGLAGGRVTLTDLDSAGGTALRPGGPTLGAHQPAEIHDGDEFWVGPEVRVALRQSSAATDSIL